GRAAITVHDQHVLPRKADKRRGPLATDMLMIRSATLAPMRIRGVDLHVQIEGSGKSFVWGHGLMFSMAMEDALGIVDFPRLAAEMSERIVRYDARGHGSSTGTDQPDDYQWPALAQDMLALADALGIDRFIAGGQSMGMATSLYAALA